MRCSEYSEWMSLDLDGLLNQVEILQLQKHVSQCEACRQEWEVMSRLSATLQAEPAVTPAPDFTARVTLRLEQRVARKRRLYSGIGLCVGSVGLWTSAAVGLLFLFLALWQPLIRVAVLDVGLSLLSHTLSLLATLGKALWSGAPHWPRGRLGCSCLATPCWHWAWPYCGRVRSCGVGNVFR